MRAAWYDRRGPARDTLVVGELPDPHPGEGQVRIAVRVSGLSPGDAKKRAGWRGAPMPYPRVIPHSDGAGTIDAVGPGVAGTRVGERVWCYGAQSYRPFGTAAELVVVPSELAVALPTVAGADDRELEEQAACLGIAGITGYRAVFADGSVAGLVVLVHGATGGVGSIAVQMARRGGATVLATVSDEDQRARALGLGAHYAFLAGETDLAAAIRVVAPGGVDRIAEVDFAGHIDLDAEILAVGGTVSSFATSSERPWLPYWDLAFKDVALRLLGSDDFRPEVKAGAAAALTEAMVEGTLRSTIVARLALEEIATAHEVVEAGAGGRVVIVL